jgi:hypothetical protein
VRKERKFRRGSFKGSSGEMWVRGGDFKEDLSRGDSGISEGIRAFTFTHTNFGGFRRGRDMREDTSRKSAIFKKDTFNS